MLVGQTLRFLFLPLIIKKKKIIKNKELNNLALLSSLAVNFYLKEKETEIAKQT